MTKSQSKSSRSAPDSGWEAESSAQPDHSPEHTSGDTCGVCLCDLEEDQAIRTFASCEHRYHKGCIDEWNQRQPTCPTCRTEDPEIRSNIAERARSEAEQRARNRYEDQLWRLEELVQENESYLTRNNPGHCGSSRANILESNEDRLARVKKLVKKHEAFLRKNDCSSSRLMKNVDTGNDFESRLNRVERLATYQKGWLEQERLEFESASESD
ncbi:hypothetical protein PCANC_12203 [Puccinia coronata f. sp. avenae]|uniref:RING-type domain-containing protein n=1 Tax=Puccinia coronata f. sp. avenae TaxID=200324 RepID=A0A2N5VEX8_9BASI|nr:hypothetical protein PCANC_12203 [Puccinia coronata f. sp. avenae]